MIFCINIVSFIRLCDPFGKSCIETIRKNKKLWETIEQNVSIQRCENGFNAEIKNLDLTFLNDIK